jgi:cardiolipin synthase
MRPDTALRACTAALAAAATVLVSACGTLPTIVPDMARSSGAPRLEGARGPLSPERSRQILERLKAGQPDSQVLDRHLALEQELSAAPLTAGNSVRLLIDGPQTYDAMLKAIAAARDNINMESYIFEQDEAGAKFAEALLAKQREGVQVNLIYDSVGTLGVKKEFFQRLADAGIRTLEFNPVNPADAKAGWDVNQRDHRKLLIVDGSVVFLGGINISSVYSGGSFSRGGSRGAAAEPADPKKRPWRDTDLEIRGPVVADYQKMFLETWRKQKAPPLPERAYFPPLKREGDAVVHAIAGAPDDPENVLYATFVSAIQSAEREILLTNAYFVPDPQMLKALKDAAGRGVDVKLILPSHSDAALVFHAGRSYYDELLSAGVQIYERRDALLHAKTAQIDGVWSAVGSTNLDWRSFLHNQEVNAVVLGADFGAQMRRAFDADLAQSDRIELSRWRWRSLDLRAKEAFARVWQYWL